MENIFKTCSKTLFYIAALAFLSGCGKGIAEENEAVPVNDNYEALNTESIEKTQKYENQSKDKKNPCGMKAKTPSGHELCLELAISPAEREKGLMFRKELAEGHGLMFFFDDDSIKGFWMKNTLIPLDIIFLDENYAAVKIFENVPKSYIGAPENEIPTVSYWGRNVLELPAGNAGKYGLKFGAKLTDINFFNETTAEK